jgi:hypothetical protein
MEQRRLAFRDDYRWQVAHTVISAVDTERLRPLESHPCLCSRRKV